MKLIRIKFRTPFKIGQGENYVDAITIYRAFIKALSVLGEPFDDILDGKVKFSSTFPVVNGKLYIKTPYKKISCRENRELEKKLKSIQYMLFDKFKEYEPPYEFECEKEAVTLKDYRGKELKMSPDTIQDVFMQGYGDYVVNYRNRMDRLALSSDPFSFVSFMPKGELGFLSTTWDKRLERALRLLEISGIGGDRNLGYGKFEVVSIDDFDYSPPNRAYKYVTSRAFTDSDFLAERFDRVSGIGGDINTVVLPLMVLLPVGSLVKQVVRRVERVSNDNVVIIDPITL